MTALDNARRAIAAGQSEYNLAKLPEWRLADPGYLGPGEPQCIAPACPHPEHERGDAGMYSCCPGPFVDIGDRVLAEYLVALLNADREAGESA